MIHTEKIVDTTIINKKWSIPILCMLYSKQKFSYKSIKTILHIPNSTVSLRLNELTKNNYIQKFVYGSKSKPHYTDYQITDFGLNYINSIIPKNM